MGGAGDCGCGPVGGAGDQVGGVSWVEMVTRWVGSRGWRW